MWRSNSVVSSDNAVTLDSVTAFAFRGGEGAKENLWSKPIGSEGARENF